MKIRQVLQYLYRYSWDWSPSVINTFCSKVTELRIHLMPQFEDHLVKSLQDTSLILSLIAKASTLCESFSRASSIFTAFVRDVMLFW